MDEKEFEVTQPKFHRFLSHAFKQGRVSQAYMLYGSPRCNFLETSHFLAKSLFCQKGGLACGTCQECTRFDQNVHPDFLEVDGFGGNVKKGDIENIRDFFAMSSVENGTKRGAYLISECGNMTEEAANSLLKFLEEPALGITAILTTSNIEGVLPTLVSRCETIKLEPLPREKVFAYLSKNQAPELSYFLSDYSGDKERLDKIANDEGYRTSVALANDFILSMGQGRQAAAFTLLNAAAADLPGSQCYNWFYGNVSRFLGDAIAQTGLFGPYGNVIKAFGLKHKRLAGMMATFLAESIRMSGANLSFTGVLAQLAQMLLRKDL
mgnify:CR=1 FL=1